jgi:type VI secretion system protein ImpL
MRWVAIILGLLVLLAVWIAGILVPDLRWIAELVTAVIVFIVLLVVFVRWLRTRLKAAAIERELMKQAASDDPEKRPEIAALRADMARAVASLKRGRNGLRGGRAALYRLPWYVIVGPSAAGKTTALERSGLSFVSNEAGSTKIRGTSGTRNCDWWFSQEAILLDTAGRFATEDDDRAEWMAFLDSLRRLRPDRPLDGLMVAVSVPDIMNATDAEREQLARKLRDRLDEVLHRLEIVLPVYLVLTKADLVAGFVEFWSDLAKPQRSQVWGASFNVGDPRLEEPARAIEGELDDLATALHARVLQRLPQERSPERRARVMQFPLEFRALGTPLGQFVESLCRPGEDAERPLLRGFYLTSGTQVGRPVDRVLSGMLRAFDYRGEMPAMTSPQGEAQSYFLADVFRSVILPDRNLAIRSMAGTRRRSLRELKAALVAIGLTAFVLIPAIVSYLHNAQLTHDVDRAAARLSSAGEASIPGAMEDPIEGVLDTLDQLDDEATGFGIPGWFGPRAARELRAPVREAYVGRMHLALRLRVAPELEAQLSRIALSNSLPDSINAPQDHTPRRAAYEAVKLYATLADPSDHIDPKWTPGQLSRLWRQTLGADAHVVSEERLQRHSANYLAALADDANAGLRWPSRPLRDVRKRLKSTGLEASQLPYHWALRRAYGQDSIMATDIADSESLKYLTFPYGTVLLEGIYTAKGWLKIRDALDSPLPPDAMIEPWVLDDSSIPNDEATLRDQMRKQYYDEYSSTWMDVPSNAGTRRSLLDRCVVISPTSTSTPAAVKDELMALKGPKGFYRTLFNDFKDNSVGDGPKKTTILGVQLPFNAEGCGSKLSSTLQPDGSTTPQIEDSPVQKRFLPFLLFGGGAKDDKGGGEGVPLEKYLSELEKLTVVLEAAGSAPTADQDTQFATTRHAIETLLTLFVEPTRTKLRKLLMAPVEMTITIKHHADQENLSKDWNTNVWTFWHDQLSERWPFNRRVRDVADYQNFQKFFQPGSGVLWDFVNKSLKDRVDMSGNHYVLKPDVNPPLRGDVIKCLNVANEITEAFFGTENGLKLSVLVDWSATDVTEAKFLLDKKPTPLVRDQWSPVKWSGENDVTLEWVQAGLPQDARGHDSFALFDLFKTLGGLKPAGSGVYSAQSPPLSVKVRSVGDNDVFRGDFFSRLECPPEIITDAP